MILAAAPAAAQSLPAAPPSQLTPGPPGPFVVDVRGLTLGVPQGSTSYPAVPAGTLIPKRGFGLDAGAHVYLFSLGPARLGVGARAVLIRATTTTPSLTTTGT